MPDKIKEVYDLISDKGYFSDEKEFRSYVNDPKKIKEVYSLIESDGYFSNEDEFTSYFDQPLKKKEDTQSVSELLTGSFASATDQQATEKPSVSSGSESNIYTFDDKSEFKLSDEGKWLKRPKGKTQKSLEGTTLADGTVQVQAEESVWKPVNEASRVAILNKKFNKQGLTGSNTYVGFPGKEENEYKNDTINGTDVWLVKRKGQTDFTVISNEGSINALNNFFKKDIKASTQATEERKGQLKAKQDSFESSKKYSFINEDLLTKSEEELVPYLKETFNKSGVGDIFKVQRLGAGYDAMKITNRYTGEFRDISLQNWSTDRNNSEAKELKSFIQLNTYKPELYRKKKQLQELEQNFDYNDYINVVENTKKINILKQEVKELEKEVNRFAKTSGDLKSAAYSKTELENAKVTLASSFIQVIQYKEKVKEYNSFNDDIQKGLNDGSITQEQYLATWKPQLDEFRNGLEVEKNNLSEVRNEAKQRSKDLDEMMAEYIDVQKDKGNFLTGTARSFVEGSGSVMDFLLAPRGKEGEVKQAFTDAISPGIVTREYLTNEDRSWFEQSIGGLANSIGASITTPGVSLVGLYASSYQNMKEQMNTPEFKDVPEYEKIIMSTIYGGVISGMEKFGLDKTFSKTPVGSKITNYLFSSAIKELPKNATQEMIESAIDKSLKNAIAKRLINVSAGTFVEGTVEGIQNASEVGLKYGYNQLKEKDYFETPKTAIEFWKGVGKDAILGTIGAGTMQSVIQAASLINRNVDANSIQSIDALTKDDALKEIVVSKVQNDVLAGEKTKEEGKEIIDNINNAVSTANKIPETLSNEDKATSFNLIKEREEIEKEISGKDEALVTSQKERINAINEELKAISVKPKTEEDAVQEQATNESVLRNEQPEMGLREVEQINAQQEVTTEEGKQKEVKLNENLPKVEVEAEVVEETPAKTQSVTDDTQIAKQEEGLIPNLYSNDEALSLIENKKGRLLNEQQSDELVKEIESNYIDSATDINMFNKNNDIRTNAFNYDNPIASKTVNGKDLRITSGLRRTNEDGKIEKTYLLYSDGKIVGEFYSVNDAKSVINYIEKKLIPTSKESLQVEEVSQVKKGDLPIDQAGRAVGSASYVAKENPKGRTVTRTTPDGTRIKGTFKIVSAKDLLPSHNPNTFSKNEAFPQNKEGKTINDRDYETDKPAQSQVIDIAQNIDERAVTQTPIVSKEGIVYDGNNRTMSRQLAAQNKTDKEYLQALRDQAEMYGFTEEDVNAIENPTLVFEVEENLPFDTKTMAMFNKQEKKAQAPLQRAVAISKRISDRAKRSLANLYESVEVPSDVTSDPKNMKQAIDILVQEGLIQEIEIPRYLDKGVATPDGVSLLEGVVMAASLNEDSIRELSVPGMGDIKKVILKNVVGLMQNTAKGSDSLTKEITGAIKIIQKAKASKITVEDYLSQYDMFKDNQYTIGEMSMALLLDTKKPSILKNFLTNYNENVGVENIFGEDTSKEAILNNAISELISDYEKIKKNLEGIAAERGKQVSESIEEAKPKPETSTEEVDNIESLKESTGKKVVDFLDKISKSIDDQLKEGLNDVTRVVPLKLAKVIVESLKAAVKAGMTLQQALSKVAKDNNLTEVEVVDAIEKLQNAKKSTPASKAAENIAKKQVTKVTVNTMSALKDQIRLEAKAAREGAKSATNAIKDTIAAVKDLFSKGILTAKQHKAILNKIRKTNFANPDKIQELIDYAEKVAQRAEYAEQIVDANNTIRSIKKAIKDKNLQDSVRQVAKRFAKVIPSQVPDSKLNEFSELLEKVFDAVKRSRVVGKNEDVAMQTKTATELDKVTEFTDKQLELQDEIRKNNLVDLFADIFDGQDTSKLSLSDVLDFIDSFNESESTKDEKYETVRKKLLDDIDGIKETVKYLTTNNEDPFTGDEVEYSNDVVNTIQRAINTDLSDVDNKTLAKIYEALDNFVVNGIVDNLNAIIPAIEANNDLKKEFKKNGKSRQIINIIKPLTTTQKLVSKVKKFIKKDSKEEAYTPTLKALEQNLARYMNNLITNLTLMFEKKFPGVTRAQQIISMLGLSDVINGYNKAIKEAQEEVDKYIDKFAKKKPNNKEFFNSENAVERGIYADLLRNILGTEKEQNNEFQRKLNLLFESTEALLKSENKKENQLGQTYQKVIDKLGLKSSYEQYQKDNNSTHDITLNEIEKNVDPINKDAVKYWIDVYSKHYEALSFISQSVYNSVLSPELNYNPVRYRKLDASSGSFKDRQDEILSKKGSFYTLTTDTEKSGTLNKTTKPRRLNEGSYISYDFDLNNSEILKSALIDINTAIPIRKFSGAKQSKYFKDIMGEKDAQTIATRIDKYIKNIKGKNMLTAEEERYMIKIASKISQLSTERVLGGTVTTALKQMIPMFSNTLATAGTYAKHIFDLKNLRQTTEWINKTGMEIANRGQEAITLIDSIDNTIEKELKGKKANLLEKYGMISKMYLRVFLSNADLFAARGAFMSYYIQDLNRKGIEFSYDGEMNQESLQYAQSMVSRQQQASDKLLQGSLYQTDSGYKYIMARLIMPFSNFTMNLKSRVYADIIALRNFNSLSETDRRISIKSMIGTLSEIGMFNLLSYGIWITMDEIADEIMSALGDDDDEDKSVKEELKKARENRRKNTAITNFFMDIASPLPMLDDRIIDLTNYILGSDSSDDIKDFDETYKNLTQSDKNEFDVLIVSREKEKGSELTKDQKLKLIKSFIKNRSFGLQNRMSDDYSAYGLFGAAGKTIVDATNAAKKLFSNEIEREGYGGKEKAYIREEDEEAKKYANTLILLHSIGLLPAEAKSIGNRMNRTVEKRAYNEKQYDKIVFLNKNVGENIMNSKIGVKTIKRENLTPKMTYTKMAGKKFKTEDIIDYIYLDGKISSDKRIELLNKLED